jgi:cobaltochelatase CobN
MAGMISASEKPVEKSGHFTEATRFDGEVKTLRVVEGHLFVCQGCCCGNTQAGNPPVPLDRFKKEWKDRGIRSRIHLTISGCLGPCAVPNIVMLIYKGETVWFHSINSNHDVVLIYEYLEHLLQLDRFALPQEPLSRKVFQRYLGDAGFCEHP